MLPNVVDHTIRLGLSSCDESQHSRFQISNPPLVILDASILIGRHQQPHLQVAFIL